jgi:mono/diheme cytochrome c family protein
MNRTTAAVAAVSLLAILATASVACAETETKKVQAGEMVYGDYCSSCHGDQLRNTSGGVTYDLRRLRPEDRERFLTAVLDGKRQMPPWRGALEMEQIESIWAYIRAKVDRP